MVQLESRVLPMYRPRRIGGRKCSAEEDGTNVHTQTDDLYIQYMIFEICLKKPQKLKIPQKNLIIPAQ